MGDPNVEILIVDANVLIDFCQTDPSVLTLVVRHVGVVNVAEPVLEEVDQLDRMTAAALGIRVVTPDFECFTRAAQLAQRSPLQFQDWVCLLLAENQANQSRANNSASLECLRHRDLPIHSSRSTFARGMLLGVRVGVLQELIEEGLLKNGNRFDALSRPAERCGEAFKRQRAQRPRQSQW